MKVSCDAEDDCLALRDTFLHIRPLPRELDRSLNGLNTSIHGKHHVIPKHFCDPLGKASEDTVVKRSRRESESLCLFHQGTNDLRVAVPLINCPAYIVGRGQR